MLDILPRGFTLHREGTNNYQQFPRAEAFGICDAYYRFWSVLGVLQNMVYVIPLHASSSPIATPKLEVASAEVLLR